MLYPEKIKIIDKKPIDKSILAILLVFYSYLRSAGTCCYQGRGGLCTIKLSTPLLKLRTRKDLVETLLVGFVLNFH